MKFFLSALNTLFTTLALVHSFLFWKLLPVFLLNELGHHTEHDGDGDLDEVVGLEYDLGLVILLPELDQLVAVRDPLVESVEHHLHRQDQHWKISKRI